MKIYVTKYAVTRGILEAEAIDVTDDCAVVRFGGMRHYLGVRDWHLDLPSALDRAEEMRLAAVASARRKIEKLEAMRFDGVTGTLA